MEQQAPLRVMVVMAEEDLRLAFDEVLRELGYQVTTCADPIAAWLRLTTEPPPAVILIDVPRQEPGTAELYALLRERGELVDTTVFLFTGREPPPAPAEGPGLMHLFDHPVDLGTLLPALNAVLGR
ncbi:MAG TPA: hypothetical protein VL172_17645 [Kofleriaceae bacterium]|nr:hypothetical protein [Kofleriaceae bacterium]